MTRKSTEFIHEGKYAAKVEIELSYTQDSWSPTMSADDECKFDAVQLTPRRGDITTALKHGRVLS
jgi:hypothetical protein